MNIKKDEIVANLNRLIAAKDEIVTLINHLEGWLQSDLTPQDWQIEVPQKIIIRGTHDNTTRN